MVNFSGQSITGCKTLNLGIFTNDMCIADEFLYVLDGNGIIQKYDLDLNYIGILYTPLINQSFNALATDGTLLYASEAISRHLFELSTGIAKDFGSITNVNFSTMFYHNNSFYLGTNNQNGGIANLLYKGLNKNSLTLDKVVSQITELSGLTSNDYDVSSLAKYNIPVEGYMLSNRMSTRSAIEPLMAAYFFDAIESDGKIKYIKKGQQSIISIPESDLSASIYGNTLPDQLIVDRKESLSLPEEVTIAYLDINSHYQTGSQYSRKLIGNIINKVTYQFPMSLDAATAKNMCDIILYSSYEERTHFSFSLSVKYLYLDPTDVIQVTKNNITYTCRLTDCDYQNNILTYNALEDDYTIYNLNQYLGTQLKPNTQSIPPSSNNINLLTPTNLKMLDIPLMRDQDDQVGYYVAVSGFSSAGWPGCLIYKSIDQGASYSQFTTALTNQSIIGNSTNILNNFTSGNIFDELNYVTVSVNGSLSSAKSLSVLNGANIAILGNEIIQFKNATLISTGIYKLSGLLRGTRGTEWAMTTHVINERFVILSPSTTYLESSSSSEYGLLREYKAVTINTLINNAIQVNFTNNAIAQKCYSPVHISGGRDSSNNSILKWTRRTRIGGSWNNFADVPIGETTELYSVDILDSLGKIKRTINSITSNNLIYTAQQQTTDFGSVQSTIYFNVYQISSILGRGYAGKGIF